MPPDSDRAYRMPRPVRHDARRLRVLTWHVHGNYLYYLSQVPHDFYLVTKPGHEPGYAGRVGRLPWGDNVREVPYAAVRDHSFDCVLFQSRTHWQNDRERVLSRTQTRLPTIYLEHDPPQESPFLQPHWVRDTNVLLVHVTPFNAMMWDSGDAAVRIIEHGVVFPEPVDYSGELDRGIVVVNHLRRRGRRLGADVFEDARRHVPLDLVGMQSELLEGLGEVDNVELPRFMSRYRFFFNPIRWTSLGLAVVEAMAIGMPVVGLAATELAAVVDRGVNGYVDTDLRRLVPVMHELLADRALARAWGSNARRTAAERFSIDRFIVDWKDAFATVSQ